MVTAFLIACAMLAAYAAFAQPNVLKDPVISREDRIAGLVTVYSTA